MVRNGPKPRPSALLDFERQARFNVAILQFSRILKLRSDEGALSSICQEAVLKDVAVTN